MAASLKEQHEFALYAPTIVHAIKDARDITEIIVTDPDVLHRMQRVLRLHTHDRITLFSKDLALYGTIGNMASRTCIIHPMHIRPVTQLIPVIHLSIALLEKPAFAAAVEYATVLGVSVIQPLITAKSKRQMLDVHERERLTRIMIAAAEQSKQFYIPHIAPEVALRKYTPYGTLLLCDATGHMVHTGTISKDILSKGISLLIGPEGGLTENDLSCITTPHERIMIAPTILRSELAVAVGLGILRNIVS